MRKSRLSPISKKPHIRMKRTCFALIQELALLVHGESCVICGNPADGGGHHCIHRWKKTAAFHPWCVFPLCEHHHNMDETDRGRLLELLKEYMGWSRWVEIEALAKEIDYNIDYYEIAAGLRRQIKEAR